MDIYIYYYNKDFYYNGHLYLLLRTAVSVGVNIDSRQFLQKREREQTQNRIKLEYLRKEYKYMFDLQFLVEKAQIAALDQHGVENMINLRFRKARGDGRNRIGSHIRQRQVDGNRGQTPRMMCRVEYKANVPSGS